MDLRRKYQPLAYALTGVSLALLFSGQAYAQAQPSEFDMGWDSFNWPTGSTGPNTFTAISEHGFELQMRIDIMQINGVGLSGFPEDRFGFGTLESLVIAWNPSFGNANVGDSTNTVTLEFLQSGVAFPIDDLSFEVTDIDSVDSNQTTDRCDFVTLTGNAGNPALSYKEPNAALRSVIFGPAAGSGATGLLAANEAQCIYNVGTPASPNSNNDDNGTVIANYPSGTHTVTVEYDESLSDIINNNNVNTAARGIGVLAGTNTVVETQISLEKSTVSTSFANVGDVITYDYTVTNDGPLIINTGQNIQIQDDQIGTFSCGTIAADIPVGGTHSCSATYTITTADALAGGVTNIATAGIGAGTQPFADRLPSNEDTVTLPYISIPSLDAQKTVVMWDPAAEGLHALPGNDVIYTITVANIGSGVIDNNSIFFVDAMPAEVEFYNDDIDDAGPETAPISFSQTGGAGLMLDPATDIAYFDGTAPPANFAACNYAPTLGYDPLVTYICFNPKGTMAAGSPDPTFSVAFRARIK